MDELYKSAGIWRRAADAFGDLHASFAEPLGNIFLREDIMRKSLELGAAQAPDVTRGLFRAQAQPQSHRTQLNRLTAKRPIVTAQTSITRMSDPVVRAQKVQELADYRPQHHRARQARVGRLSRYEDVEDARDIARNRAKLDALRDDANNFMSEATRFAGEAPVSAAPPVAAVPPAGAGRFDHIDMSRIDIPSPSGDYLRSGSGRQSNASRLDELMRGPGPRSAAPQLPAARAPEPPSATTSAASTAVPPTPLDDTRAAIEREVAQIRELQRRGDELDAQIRAGLETSPSPASAVPPSDAPTAPRASEGPASAAPPSAQGPGPSAAPRRPASDAVPPPSPSLGESPTPSSTDGIDPRVWRYGIPTVAALGVGGGLAYNQLRDRPWYDR